MKNKTLKKKLSLVTFALLCMLWMSISALASGYTGQLDSVDHNSITGWACDYSRINEAVSVELQIFSQESNELVKTFTVSANETRSDFTDNLGQVGHGFNCQVNWAEFEEGYYNIKAYVLADGQKSQISDDNHCTVFTGDFERGPGIESSAIALSKTGDAGKPLGTFQTTGYCNCSICSSGHNLTYSGTVPKANHTISADLNVLPLGSKVLINGIIYTVEDKGSSVVGNKIDIYYDDHDEASSHGLQTVEVYLVE